MNNELFAISLGIEEPLYISSVEFIDTILHVYIAFRRGTKFTCNCCNNTEMPVHDTVKKEWRHLNFFQYHCILHFNVPRTICPTCGIRQWKTPWESGTNGFTVQFKALIISMVTAPLAVSKVAEFLEVDDCKIWRVINEYVEENYAQLDFSKITKLGIDETSIKKGHKYITIFADVKTGKVIFICEGKDSSTVKKLIYEGKKHNFIPEQITDVTQDMSEAFVKGVTENFPNAVITFDKFHVFQALNKALDATRSTEAKESKILLKTRYIWLKNEENLAPKQLKKRDELLDLEYLKTAEIYRQKQILKTIFDNAKNANLAEFLLTNWLNQAKTKGISKLNRFIKTFQSHMDGILRHFDSKLTSGFMESINSRIQQIKRMAKGFSNINNFKSILYLNFTSLRANITHSF